MVTNIYKI